VVSLVLCSPWKEGGKYYSKDGVSFSYIPDTTNRQHLARMRSEEDLDKSTCCTAPPGFLFLRVGVRHGIRCPSRRNATSHLCSGSIAWQDGGSLAIWWLARPTWGSVSIDIMLCKCDLSKANLSSAPPGHHRTYLSCLPLEVYN
jgi:hypothetical protein